jgi:hypothetical protein
MRFTAKELLGWAAQHEGERWATLRQAKPFHYRVTSSGIEYTPSSGVPRNIPLNELTSFCEQFDEVRSFSPGRYPKRWHKSYTLPLIKAFLREKGVAV